MAYQLHKHQLLNKVVTAHPASRYLNRVALSKAKVKFLPPIFVISHLFSKFKICPSNIRDYINYKLPLLYDKLASRNITGANIAITWAWAGLNTIKAIKEKGGIAIVEECGSCNVFQNNLLEEEYNNLSLKFTNRTPNFILARELEEIKLADYVLCPSAYVAQSFIQTGIDADKCKIIPYGVNLTLFKALKIPKQEFNILFVGTIGVRKGLIYLFKALETLSAGYNLKCTLIGSVEDQFLAVFNQYQHLFTHLARVPHHQLIDYYNNASVFVFPSLDEGMAYVQLEAMACGLPVICTFNSGGDSVIENGIEGFIVPIKDEKTIADKIEYLYLNPAKQQQMAANAEIKAARFSWDIYGDKLAGFINSL
jgi:glycosyltransferase involved in cell wall biosynthesis